MILFLCEIIVCKSKYNMNWDGIMNDKARVKDYITNIDELLQEHNNKICIVAGVGSGKSRWVTNNLKSKGDILFINSRKAKVNEDIQNTEFNNFSYNFYIQPYLEMTNSKLGCFIKDDYFDKFNFVDDLIDNYDYIVIDEAHSIATDAVFADSSFHVQAFIEYVIGKNKPVILMTGTVEPIREYLDENGWFLVDLMEKCYHVQPRAIEVINGDGLCNIEQLLKKTIKDGEIVYFSNTVSNIKKLYSQILKFNDIDFNNIAVVLGNESQDEFNKEFSESKEINEKTYKEITKNKRIPNEIKILLSTSTLREGINIENGNIATIFCENHILSNIIQFMGRIRKNLDTVYIIKNAGGHYVNLSEIRYDFAKKAGLEAANNYFVKELTNKKRKDLEEFICHIENTMNTKPSSTKVGNSYIRFNYILGKFELSELLYNEQKRLIKCENSWEEDLSTYCYQNKIKYENLEESAKANKLAFMEKLSNSTLDYKHIDTLFRFLRVTCGIKYRQRTKVNEELKKQGVPYVIVAHRLRSGEHKGKTMYQVRKA